MRFDRTETVVRRCLKMTDIEIFTFSFTRCLNFKVWSSNFFYTLSAWSADFESRVNRMTSVGESADQTRSETDRDCNRDSSRDLSSTRFVCAETIASRFLVFQILHVKLHLCPFDTVHDGFLKSFASFTEGRRQNGLLATRLVCPKANDTPHVLRNQLRYSGYSGWSVLIFSMSPSKDLLLTCS